RLNPSHQMSQSPPTSANGSESMTIIVSVTERIERHTCAPLLLRLQIDDGLKHFGRRRVRGRRRSTGFPVDRCHFRKRADDPVLGLHQHGGFCTEMPGRVVGMYSSVPSLRFGMNSVPSSRAGQIVTPSVISASRITNVFARSTPAITGR